MLPFTVFDLLRCAAARHPEKAALELGHAAITYGELHRQSNALACRLLELGVKRGDRVGIHLPKSFEEVIATFSCARLGAVFVNISPQWTLPQLEHIVRDCSIRVLVTDARKARQIIASDVGGRLDHLIVTESPAHHAKMVAWAEIQGGEPSLSYVPIDVDLAALLYTSGSTGHPKGVMLTHRNIVLGAQSVATYLRNTENDRIMSLPPLSFDYGLNQITTMFLVGGTAVLQPAFMPVEIIKTIQAKSLTGVGLVPPVWIRVVGHLQEFPTPLPSLRYITNTGGAIPPPILEAMPKVFPQVDIFLMYGLTEAFRSTYLPPHLFKEKMGSIGRAIPNTEIFVVDPEKGLCGPGEVGELLHRGGSISQGYWGNPEATHEKIRVNPHLLPLIGEEKVVHSGDLVRIDADGCLWFVGRDNAMIKCNAIRLSPTEVEEALCRLRGITDAVAYGVDDEELGQVVHAVVTCAPDFVFDAKAVEKFCLETMPHYMIPRQVHVWDGEMPRTSSGKIDRRAVVDRFHTKG